MRSKNDRPRRRIHREDLRYPRAPLRRRRGLRRRPRSRRRQRLPQKRRSHRQGHWPRPLQQRLRRARLPWPCLRPCSKTGPHRNAGDRHSHRQRWLSHRHRIRSRPRPPLRQRPGRRLRDHVPPHLRRGPRHRHPLRRRRRCLHRQPGQRDLSASPTPPSTPTATTPTPFSSSTVAPSR